MSYTSTIKSGGDYKAFFLGRENFIIKSSGFCLNKKKNERIIKNKKLAYTLHKE